VAKEDARGIQYWVIQTLAKRIPKEKNPSILSRRDMALLAFLCVAPARGNPRNWPRNCLKIYGGDVILWDKRVGGTGLRVSFFMLLAYLERTADQARSEATLRQIGTVESLRAPFPRPARAWR
jgi:hypothetical protein